MLIALLMTAATAATAPPADRTAIFMAAGFIRHGADWRTKNCEGMEGASYTPGNVDEYRDLNGDGRPEAVISEGSAACYGNTETHFWLLSKQASGAWKPIYNETAVPEFLKTKGVDGWPDLLLGGPGFCFPVMRWNGQVYVDHGQQYEGKPCKS
jgi:hypothetical protein